MMQAMVTIAQTSGKENRMMYARMMNCSGLDTAVGELQSIATSEGGVILGLGSLASASVAMLVIGEHIVRPLGGIVAGVLATGAMFVVTSFTSTIDCIVRIIVALGTGLTATVAALCLLKTGIFLVGAASFGAAAHYVYDALPLDGLAPAEDTWMAFGVPVYYLATVGISGIVGAVMAHVAQRQLLRVTTALLGGCGVALTVHIVTEVYMISQEIGSGASTIPNPISPLILLCIAFLSTLSGVGAQTYIAKRKIKKPKKDDEEKKKNAV